MTKREQVLRAVEAALGTVAGAKVVRNADRPMTVDPGGMIILRDGDPGEPEVLLSPLLYCYDHQATIELYVQKGTKTARATSFDQLVEAVGQALAADRTFGGLCTWSQPGAPDTGVEAPEGAATVTSAEVLLTLSYETSDPLA